MSCGIFTSQFFSEFIYCNTELLSVRLQKWSTAAHSFQFFFSEFIQYSANIVTIRSLKAGQNHLVTTSPAEILVSDYPNTGASPSSN